MHFSELGTYREKCDYYYICKKTFETHVYGVRYEVASNLENI
uniref:Uncharacterized protein n=1 Tax=Tetranychus urticae TaxID=32264 RepID=T1KIR5_TETUR